MASGYNNVVLVGKVDRAPNYKQGHSPETDVTRIYLNVAEFRKDKNHPDGGGWHDNIILVRVIGKAAEKAGELKAGDRILVEGTTDQLKWEEKDPNTNRVKLGPDNRPIKRSMLTVKAFAVKRGGSDNFNRVVIMGRVGRDAEIKFFESGGSIANFSVATNEWVKDDNHEKGGYEVAVWTDVKVVGRRAEGAAQYIKKGSNVLVEGQLITDTWEKDGQKQSRTYLKAWDYKFAGGGPRPGSSGSSGYDDIPDEDYAYTPRDSRGGEATWDDAPMGDEIPF